DTITFFADDGASGTVLNGNYVISFSSTTDAVGSGYPVTNVANTASFYTGNLGGAIGASFSVTGASYVFNPANGNLLMDIVVTNQDNVGNGGGNSYNKADYTGIQTSRAVDAGSGVYSGTGALVTEFNTSPAVPEPASWALMIAGFGMMGAAMRRRRTAVTA
ncbi:MAG TPA: PEPxxWA-CTERM sorting domain-containing protein, partial [Polymorphobacter sp.]|nr:PEPxxWA-CTERM sorting domain-containing protein [Polymorphobacter sp.]